MDGQWHGGGKALDPGWQLLEIGSVLFMSGGSGGRLSLLCGGERRCRRLRLAWCWRRGMEAAVLARAGDRLLAEHDIGVYPNRRRVDPLAVDVLRAKRHPQRLDAADHVRFSDHAGGAAAVIVALPKSVRDVDRAPKESCEMRGGGHHLLTSCLATTSLLLWWHCGCTRCGNSSQIVQMFGPNAPIFGSNFPNHPKRKGKAGGWPKSLPKSPTKPWWRSLSSMRTSYP